MPAFASGNYLNATHPSPCAQLPFPFPSGFLEVLFNLMTHFKGILQN